MIWVYIGLTALLWGMASIADKLGVQNGGNPLGGLIVRTSAVVIIIAVLALGGGYREVKQMPLKATVFFVMSGLMAGVFGMLTYYSALKFGEVTKVVPLTATYPFIAVVLAYLVLGESWNWQRLIGTVLIVMGAWLVKAY